MVTAPLSEAKARLSEIADEVGRTHERVHITRNGREYVVLLAAEDLESIEATLELLRWRAARTGWRGCSVTTCGCSSASVVFR